MSAIRTFRSRAHWPWPPRRASAEVPAIGYESGFLAGTFEPEETLGDTDPVPLDAVATNAENLEQHARWPELVVLALAVLFGFAWHQGWIA